MPTEPYTLDHLRRGGEAATVTELALIGTHLVMVGQSIRDALDIMNLAGNSQAAEASLDLAEALDALKRDIEKMRQPGFVAESSQ